MESLGRGGGGVGYVEGRDEGLVEVRERDRIEETVWRGSCGGGGVWGGME